MVSRATNEEAIRDLNSKALSILDKATSGSLTTNLNFYEAISLKPLKFH